MQWTNGAYGESWTFVGTTLSEMPTSVALPTSHRFHPSLSPVVSLSVGILHEWMRMQMLAKPSLNLFQRTGGDHRGGRAQPGWRTFMMTCHCWILGFMRLEIWCKIALSGDWCLCTALHTRSGACYYWIGAKNRRIMLETSYAVCMPLLMATSAFGLGRLLCNHTSVNRKPYWNAFTISIFSFCINGLFLH